MITSVHVLVGLPILGAMIGLFLGSKPKGMRGWFLFITTVELFLLLRFPPHIMNALTAPLLLLIALSACVLVLGYPQRGSASELFNLLFFSGLGFGYLLSPDQGGLIYLVGILALIIVIQLRTGRFSDPHAPWLFGLYGLSILCLITSPFLEDTYRQIALFVVYITLLPLFPFHGAYLSLLRNFHGILPAFLSLFLPILGFFGLAQIYSELPEALNPILLVCALLGLMVGALRSFKQNSLSQLLSQVALVFWSILWWYILGPEAKLPPAVIFLCASSLTLSGLFLSWLGLKSRYGDLTLEQFGGLASAMPRFGILFSLLIASAMGLPFFGVFSGFIEMAFSHSNNFSVGLVIILLAWFLVSWTLPVLMQKILFGPVKTDWIHRDFGRGEIISLSLIIIVLILIGIAPYRLFGLTQVPNLFTPIMDVALWQK